MKLGAGAIFVAIGLLVLWFAINGHLSKFFDLWQASGNSAADPNKAMSGPASRGSTSHAAALAASLNIPPGFPALPGLN